jgi:hypothetical protein
MGLAQNDDVIEALAADACVVVSASDRAAARTVGLNER